MLQAIAVERSQHGMLAVEQVTQLITFCLVGGAEGNVEAEPGALAKGALHLDMAAMALRHGSRTALRLVETRVRMRSIDDAALERYLDAGDWQGKAGGYAIQGAAAAFIPWLEGSFSAVVGLPLSETAAMLAAIGIHPTPQGGAA